MNRPLSVFLLIVLTTFLSGCSLLNPYNLERAIASDEKKVAMLNKRVEKFHRDMYWGGLDQAGTFVAPEARRKFLSAGHREKRSRRFVDFNVENVTFADDNNEADVEVLVRYYRIPSYVVESKREVEKWKFHRWGAGWLMHSKEEVSAAKVDEVKPSVPSAQQKTDFRSSAAAGFAPPIASKGATASIGGARGGLMPTGNVGRRY